MLIILIKLIAAHLIGDFILQTDSICQMKYSTLRHERTRALIIHGLIQALLAYVFVGQWLNWILPTIIAFSHIIIDAIKVELRKNGLIALLVDQAAHYMVLFAIWWFMYLKSGLWSGYVNTFMSLNAWMVLTSYVAVLTPTSILIKTFIEYERWAPMIMTTHGLPNAGKWIGYLERILILTFIYTNNVEGVGFLLAAKSVFRFGELNRAKDLKITEYVLIGTFASFAIAILIGFAVKWII